MCDNVPIIMLTANAVVGAKEQFLSAGFDDYLTKPIEPEKLDKAILEYLPKELIIEGEMSLSANHRRAQGDRTNGGSPTGNVSFVKMKKRNVKDFCVASCSLIVFLLWTVMIQVIDVRAIGPHDSSVGFATF